MAWCRPRSSSRTTTSTTSSAASGTACRRRSSPTDAAYFRSAATTSSRATGRSSVQTRTEFGCPYDCGLCPDHEQHSCLALIDVNEACNLTCPVCFCRLRVQSARAPAARRDRLHARCAGRERRRARPHAALRRRADHPPADPRHHRARQGEADPPHHAQHQRHPDRRRSRISSKRLAAFKPGFEVYLQFDSLRADVR